MIENSNTTNSTNFHIKNNNCFFMNTKSILEFQKNEISCEFNLSLFPSTDLSIIFANIRV
jgi:hypothetical protein